MKERCADGFDLKPIKVRSRFIHLSGFALCYIVIVFCSLPGSYDVRAACFTPPPAGLVSWWRGEGNPTDTVSTNNGTLSGGVSFATGEVGQAFSFDGTGEVAVPGTPPLNVTTFTLEAWVNPSVLDGNMEIILNKENSPAFNETDVSYELAIRGTADPGGGSIPVGQLAFFVGGITGLQGEYGSWVGGGGMIPTNQWSHCALTFDGRTMTVYINGARTRTFDGASGTVIATTGPFKIGSRSALQVSAAPASRFNGLIDEVSVYSRALSEVEILAIYNAKGAGKCLTTNPPCANPPEGLAGWWKGDGNTLDQIGSNNGTLVGNATFAPGRVGEGFLFDGLGSYVSAGSSESLRFTNQLSISAWIFPTGPGQHPQYGGIILNREGEYELGRFADGTIGWAFANQGSIWTWLSSGAIAPLNQWTHVALTFNNGFVFAFLNGQFVQSNSGNPTIGDIYPGSNELRIGNRQEDGQGFAGVIDEVAIFNRALTTNEVAAIYSAGAAGMCPLSSGTNCSPAALGLVGWWKADANAGDVVSGNTGVLQNVGYTNGVVGQAFSFDPSSFPSGTYNGVQIPDQPAYALTNSLTIEGWVRPRGDGYVIFWRGDNRTGLDPYALSMQANHTLLFQISAENGNSASVEAALPYNQWIHVAGTLDGGSGMMSIYTNGALVSQTTTAIRPFGDLIANDFPGVGIGNVNDGRNNFPFTGDIDEISLYARALSPAEIQAIYNVGSAGKCAPSTPPPPVLAVITSQPTNLTVYVGSNATFRVTATGTAPLSYQWRFDGNDLPGKTSSVLSLNSVQFSNAGPYSVVIGNAAGSITSSIASLTVKPLPNCTPPPAGLVSWWRAEKTATDDWDSNNGTTPLGLVTVPGKVGSAFSFSGRGYIQVADSPSLRLTNGFTFEAWVNPSTVLGTTPRVIISKFDYPPQTPVGTQSAYLVGTTNNGLLFFTVSATGSARTNTTLVTSQALPINQWSLVVATYDGSALRLYLNGSLAAQTNYSGGIFPGSANLSLGAIRTAITVATVFGWPFSGLLDDVSLYNRALTDDEIHAIFVSDFVGKCLVGPSIATQPRDQAVPLGEDVKFSVSVLGSGPLKYQWRFNGANLANATNSALVLEKVQTNRVGNYSVFVTNVVGSTTSSIATLTLLPAPTCTDTPAGLLSWWPADGNTADAMGTNNVFSPEPSRYATGKVGQAFSFNGISSRIGTGPTTTLNFGTNADFSIEMWIKPGASNTIYPNIPLFEKRDIGQFWIGYSLSLNQGRLAFAMGSSPISPTNVSTFISSGPDLRDAMFHHVAACVNRTSTDGGRLYVDGQLVLIFDPTPRKGSLSTPAPVYLGAPSFPLSNSYFGGLIDETAIYNRALSAAEILAIRQAGAAGKCKVKPFIVVQPVSQRVTVGTNVTVTVGAAGTPLLRYQWMFSGGGNISGATSSTFTLNVQNNVSVSVRVTNLFGSIISSKAVLIANHAPTASGQAVSLDEDTPTTISLIGSDSDGDPLNYTIVTPPSNGVLSGTGSNVLYTPKPNYFGSDSFTFNVSDGLLDSAPGTVTLTVRPVNDPPIADASATTTPVLSPNNTNATVVLDGSRSFDVEGDTLQYRWFLGLTNEPLATGIVAIVVLPVGTNSISLVVSDGAAAGTNTINVEVITTAQSLERLVAKIHSDVSRSAPLITTLRAAIASIDRGNPTAAINQLQAFQNQVLAQLEPLDPEAAQTLIQTIHEVIDVLGNGTPGSSPGGGAQSIRIESLVRQSDGKFRMKFSVPSGKTYVVAASVNMLDWELIGVAVNRGDGSFEFEDRTASRFTTRFYRIISP